MSRAGQLLSLLNPFSTPDLQVPLDAIIPGSASLPIPFDQAVRMLADRPPVIPDPAPGPDLFTRLGMREELAITPPLDVREVAPQPRPGEEYHQLPYLSMWPTFGDPTWKPPQARKAINAMDAGDFQMAGLLMEELLKDDAQYHGLRTRQMKVIGLPRRIVPSKRRGGKRAARLFAQYQGLVFPPGIVREILKYLYHFRFTICEIVDVKVQNPDGTPPFWHIPQLKPWHPSFIFWRPNLGNENAMWGGDQIGGNYVLVTRDGILDLVGENAPGAGRFVLINAGGSRPWLDGILRPAWQPVLRRFYTRRDHARFEERHALGIVKVKYPTYMGGESNEWKAFQQSLRTMGSNGVIMCPRDREKPEVGVDAEFIGPPNAAALQSFDLSKKEQDLDIYTLWLAQSLTTAAGQNGGSHAALLGMERKEDELARDDSTAISDAQIEWYVDDEQQQERWRMVPADGPLREQVWRYFAYYNFGDPNVAPYVLWDATPQIQRKDAEELKKTRAATQQLRALAAQQLGNAIANLTDAKQDFDGDYLFEQVGLYLKRPIEDPDRKDDVGLMRGRGPRYFPENRRRRD